MKVGRELQEPELSPDSLAFDCADKSWSTHAAG